MLDVDPRLGHPADAVRLRRLQVKQPPRHPDHQLADAQFAEYKKASKYRPINTLGPP
jgi:hypothetical protein